MLHAPTPLPTSSSRSPVGAAPAAGDAGATDHLREPISTAGCAMRRCHRARWTS